MAEPIDFAPFGLDEGSLRSLAAAAADWRSALAGEAADDYGQLLAGLPAGLSDAAWQAAWLQCWVRMGDEIAGAIQRLFATQEACESRLLDGSAPPTRLHRELAALLRRGAVAASCAGLEARDEVRRARAGIAGELTAVQIIDRQAAALHRLGLLSLRLSDTDTYGHVSASDLQQLPTLIVDRLRQLLLPQDQIFAGRQGEWLLLLPEVESRLQPSLAAVAIQRAFAEPVRLASGRPLRLGTTIGAALLPEHGRQGEDLVRAARLARWSAAGDGLEFTWFRPEHDADWQRRSALSRELEEALQHNALQLYLQPQVELPGLACRGAELLLRWQRADGEWIPPQFVIELIEQNGWRSQFTNWLLRSAMRCAVELQEAGIRTTLSINLTAHDLRDPDLPGLIEQHLATWDLPAERFMIELTESAIMGRGEQGLAVIEELRRLGLRISLDDFGTGYSSLSYLVHLPVQELKLDRSFVIAMFDSEQAMRVVRTLIDLACDLGLEPLAEGIDDPRQAECLQALGCRLGQGFLYAEPLPLPAFVAWFRRQAGRA